MVHESSHPLAGVIVELGHDIEVPRLGNIGRTRATVVDWWDRYHGRSWQKSFGAFPALHYALRSGAKALPYDDEVVLVILPDLSLLVHDSEIRGVVARVGS